MADIYDQHAAAFARVSAFVILKGGERVATVAFKYPADGAGRLYAYVHWLGLPMVRGSASGYGYDKRTASVESALEKIGRTLIDNGGDSAEFADAIQKATSGHYWDRLLEDAGFTVLQAV